MNTSPDRRTPKGRKPTTGGRASFRSPAARPTGSAPRKYSSPRPFTRNTESPTPRGAGAPRPTLRNTASTERRPFSPRNAGFSPARSSSASAPFRSGARPTERPSERSRTYTPRTGARPFPPRSGAATPRGASAPFRGTRPIRHTEPDQYIASSHFADSRSTPRATGHNAGRPRTPRTPSRAFVAHPREERPSVAPRKRVVPQKPPRTRSVSFTRPAAEESWGNVAEWYHEHLEATDTYHRQVLLPHLLRLVDPKKNDAILDLACGEGFFSRAFHEQGATVTGVDVGEALIKIAKEVTPEITYIVHDAAHLESIKKSSVDQVTIILALQNIEHIQAVFSEVARVLRKDGTFHIVLNHPAFRIPKSSSWEFDEKKHAQYRRVDAYLSETRSEMDMHPGIPGSTKTLSFHRPLQVYFKGLLKAGFMVNRLEEWISHKTSDSGPRAQAENLARKEIPLFLYLSAKKS